MHGSRLRAALTAQRGGASTHTHARTHAPAEGDHAKDVFALVLENAGNQLDETAVKHAIAQHPGERGLALVPYAGVDALEQGGGHGKAKEAQGACTASGRAQEGGRQACGCGWRGVTNPRMAASAARRATRRPAPAGNITQQPTHAVAVRLLGTGHGFRAARHAANGGPTVRFGTQTHLGWRWRGWS